MEMIKQCEPAFISDDETPKGKLRVGFGQSIDGEVVLQMTWSEALEFSRHLQSEACEKFREEHGVSLEGAIDGDEDDSSLAQLFEQDDVDAGDLVDLLRERLTDEEAEFVGVVEQGLMMYGYEVSNYCFMDVVDYIQGALAERGLRVRLEAIEDGERGVSADQGDISGDGPELAPEVLDAPVDVAASADQ